MKYYQYPVVELYSGGVLGDVGDLGFVRHQVAGDEPAAHQRELVIRQAGVQPSHKRTCQSHALVMVRRNKAWHDGKG